MSYEFLSEEVATAQLHAAIAPLDRDLYDSLHHVELSPAFAGRAYLVLQSNGAQEYPTVLGTIRVLGFEMSSEEGGTVAIKDMNTGEEMVISHVPTRVFDYDVFMSVPQSQRITWGLRKEVRSQQVSRCLSFAVLIKMHNRPSHNTPGAVYMMTPNHLHQAFPNLHVNF